MHLKKLAILLALSTCTVFSAGCGSQGAQSGSKPAAQAVATSTGNGNSVSSMKLAYRTEDGKAPIVYFTKNISSADLKKAYDALGQKPKGKVGLKVIFEEPGVHYLPAEMSKDLLMAYKGTFLDSTYIVSPRDTADGSRKVAEEHGFAKVGPIDILDADGDMDLPVDGKVIKFHRVGAHLKSYQTVISIVPFKAHYIRDYDGALKGITIPLASVSGKCNLHSGGTNLSSYQAADMEVFLQSMADGAKTITTDKDRQWAFINVLDAEKPTDNCNDAPSHRDIGILVSLDPVALDQACVDMTFGQSDPAKQKHWEEIHNVRILDYAEKSGVGKRYYRLVELK